MTLNLGEIIQLLIFVICALSIYGIIELIRIFIGVRKMIARVDVATDIAGWFSFFKAFKQKKSKKNS